LNALFQGKSERGSRLEYASGGHRSRDFLISRIFHHQVIASYGSVASNPHMKPIHLIDPCRLYSDAKAKPSQGNTYRIQSKSSLMKNSRRSASRKWARAQSHYMHYRNICRPLFRDQAADSLWAYGFRSCCTMSTDFRLSEKAFSIHSLIDHQLAATLDCRTIDSVGKLKVTNRVRAAPTYLNHQAAD
jgi:hypothetical protein